MRVSHWALAGCVAGCLLLHEGGRGHEALGYAALALALTRTLGGFVAATPRLRFANFVRGARATWAYLRALRAHAEPRHLGHNPLGGWMIVALLAFALAAAGSGALCETDRFWGDPVVYALHQGAGWAFALLAPLHVAGVVFTSRRQRENLIAAMISGRKRAPRAGDVD